MTAGCATSFLILFSLGQQPLNEKGRMGQYADQVTRNAHV